LDADEDSELSCYNTILPETLGLDVALSNQRSDFALQASWVVDSATHVHVGNNPDRFESIKPCHQILLTGDGTTVIEDYGITYAIVQKPGDSKKKMRLHAAYIPNFHMNLISTILLRKRGEIYLDEYTMQLQRKPNRECYAKLHTHYRMTVAEYKVLLACKEHRDEMLCLKAELMKNYEMRDRGELHWFPNIRIIRDRQQRKLWLCQDAYIDKIVQSRTLGQSGHPLSVSRKDLIKFDGQTDPQHVHAYQRRIGSVIYLAVITRPDIALAVSLLAVFLTNPSPRHRAEADRIISYLRDTKYVAIEYSANGIYQASIKTYPHETRHPVFEASSDAAFGDDPDTRRRSEGFLFRLFGGPVDWKATRQPHITTLRLKPNY
jgi:hypothetical protein